MIVIDNKFDIGQFVYLTTDEEQKKRVVIGVKYCPDDLVLYEVQCGLSLSCHHAIELSSEKDIEIKINA